MPGLYRTGEEKLPDVNEELQRLSHYVPWKVLDAAEVQAQRQGFENVQDYCTALLVSSIENERVREHVKDVEARHGTLDGLRAIADDPEYLAELSAASFGHSGPSAEVGPLSGPMSVALPIGIQFLEPDVVPPGASLLAWGEPLVVEPLSERFPNLKLENVRPESTMPPSLATQAVLRHAGQLGDDPYGFLACLRRGQSVPPAEVAELAQALNQIEREYQGVKTMERGLTFALHRLAFESQILHTDAWPGTFDNWTVDMLRAVQEAVERILSGQDIRYYAGTAGTNTKTDPRPERPR